MTPTTARKFVYLFRLGEHYKIGRSGKVEARSLNFSNLPYDLEIIHSFPSARSGRVENALHRRFAAQQIRSEWFRLSEDDVRLIKSVGETDTPDDLPQELRPPPRPPVIVVPPGPLPARRTRGPGAQLPPTGFGRRLLAVRKGKKLSRKKLAEMARVSAAAIESYESEGKGKEPTAPVLLALCRALGASPDELLGWPEDNTPAPPAL